VIQGELNTQPFGADTCHGVRPRKQCGNGSARTKSRPTRHAARCRK
jgi:hypothetical protein